MTAPSPVFAARGLCRTFPAPGAGGAVVRAVDDVTLDLAPGTINGLLGPDGAGKTTLLRLAAGLLLPDAGSLTVLGRDTVAQAQAVQSAIGYMPQRFGLYEDLSVAENLSLYADLHGVSAAQKAERWPALMRMTGLAPFLDRLAGRLSGGMKQKLGLACTLVRSPRLLLLDEPTVGVDPLSRRELWNIVFSLVREHGITVLVSTAYLDEAEHCDRVAIMHHGRLVGDGAPGHFTRPLTGRTWFVTPAMRARTAQTLLSAAPGVTDAVLHAGGVRLLTETPQAARALVESGLLTEGESAPGTIGRLHPRAPGFEDGFLALFAALPQEAGTDDRPAPGRDALPAATPAPYASATDAPDCPAPGQPSAQAAEPPNSHPDSHPDSHLDSTPVIEVRGLERRFGTFMAVKGASFDVRRGEIFGLLGPNGAGKSTIFRMLCGLLPPTGGSLRVAGVDLRRAPAAARRRVGYVAQKFSLYGQLSVLENLRFFASAYGLYGAARDARMAWALRDFDLADVADAQSGDLSLGYRQRLAMACALMHEPDILFLDEATSGVDPLARREFWRRITALAESGVTVIVTTHFLDEAEYCDRMAILVGGEVLALGTPAEIRALAPAADETTDGPREAAQRDDGQRDAPGHASGQATIERAFIALAERHRAKAPGATGATGVKGVADVAGTPGQTAPSSGPGMLPLSGTPDAAHPVPAGQAQDIRPSALRGLLLRMRGLLRKEWLQVVRDPSAIAIALVMPVVLLFLFGYGISLDARDVPVAIVTDDLGPEAMEFAARLLLADTFRPRVVTDMRRAEQDLRAGRVDAIVHLQSDFARRLSDATGGATGGAARPDGAPPAGDAGTVPVQLIVNGVDPNNARTVSGYVTSVWQSWLSGRVAAAGQVPAVRLATRMWFNPTSDSRYFLVPGLMVLIMTLTGALLTAMVMAREWERGTMEALLVTPVRMGELLTGKLLPYFVLGMGGMVLTVIMALYLFGVPLRGSLAVLAGASSLFLTAALGMGLFISVLARNQFIAGQAALLATFLPALFLSGFIFDLESTPGFVQAVSYVIAARYFATLLKTIFLAGEVWEVIVPNALALAALAFFFLTVARLRCRKRLD
ncbi:ATP-binding cassette domain-containing protein [Nitratidesulfovibrio sp. SRB-5]|uniref:ATP-binding cassette domain-containing protein n=1 Tax=Nitratidesulfovibrio sp. SRB-5 TaxID=2872636 RepID=UPI0010278EB2|nr:ATP-binding cassette domain-containing protein [Nitratidesulfovibrio sp. SRB-5]MBZ2173225.1 ATP-binding cassette domain-containing protein [Nitratidesulfovibrio sp. SRB-5]RXF75842.1 ABC transporter ATP-binding protein/permease [Desulfovibrio sp. DS-1]